MSGPARCATLLLSAAVCCGQANCDPRNAPGCSEFELNCTCRTCERGLALHSSGQYCYADAGQGDDDDNVVATYVWVIVGSLAFFLCVAVVYIAATCLRRGASSSGLGEGPEEGLITHELKDRRDEGSVPDNYSPPPVDDTPPRFGTAEDKLAAPPGYPPPPAQFRGAPIPPRHERSAAWSPPSRVEGVPRDTALEQMYSDIVKTISSSRARDTSEPSSPDAVPLWHASPRRHLPPSFAGDAYYAV
eukprot:TRINITY_DN1357_c0_g1_i6.p1 TRINITY_DN1357_c0_g1~~TRINITY_DN1357_c0_g1_i6.p1  ORF type:complete len:246 (+),score=12.37 TRINITY_DN1357_c0_g1_i6:76-813(+)